MLSSRSKKNMPRYMAPTIGEIKKRENPHVKGDPVPLENTFRRGDTSNTTPKNADARSLMDISTISAKKLGTSIKPEWRPTNNRDQSLEQSFLKPIAN